MRRLAISGITLTVAERVESSFTSIGTTSERVLGIATAVPARDFELISCYLHEPSGAVGASHLEIAGTPAGDGVYRIVPASELASARAGWCLLDHTAHVRDLLAARCGAPVLIDVPDPALERAALTWAG